MYRRTPIHLKNLQEGRNAGQSTVPARPIPSLHAPLNPSAACSDPWPGRRQQLPPCLPRCDKGARLPVYRLCFRSSLTAPRMGMARAPPWCPMDGGCARTRPRPGARLGCSLARGMRAPSRSIEASASSGPGGATNRWRAIIGQADCAAVGISFRGLGLPYQISNNLFVRCTGISSSGNQILQMIHIDP